MNPKRMLPIERMRSLVAVLCCLALVPGETLAYVPFRPPAQSQATSSGEVASKIPAEQLDSLVAPIALYPDPLLAQVLVVSTYPLEVVQLHQWLEKNKNLKDTALADAVQKQPWDPAIQAMAAYPDVVKLLMDNIQWTTDLGNAFLAQQSDVMDAVQRMRVKAKDTGNLKTTEQQVVETKVVESKQVIVIQPAQPDVVYVPRYDPVVVYGAPVYPYYPIAYPPGYYAAGMALSFGLGMMAGAAWGGGWCCNAGWGGNNVYINNNNNFVNHYNRQNVNRQNVNRPSQLPARGGSNNWQHRPEHRGGAPYRDRATADRFGGSARGDSLANRQAGARQQIGRQGGNPPSNRAGGPGVSNRAAGGGLGGGAGVSNRAGGGGLGGGADRVGSRDVSRGGGGGDRNAFGGQGYNGSRARADSNRGASSMGSRGGGGFGGGGRGGGFGGGGRGGGRRR